MKFKALLQAITFFVNGCKLTKYATLLAYVNEKNPVATTQPEHKIIQYK